MKSISAEIMQWELYQDFGVEAMVFLRPNEGDKAFKGGLTDIQDFKTVLGMVGQDELVLISSPKTVRGEWRFVVSKKEIIAVSCYIYQGLLASVPSAPVGALALVDCVLNTLSRSKWFPDPVFCIDVCQDGDNNFWVCELTSFSSAGLYSCNKQAIVNKVTEVAIEEFQKTKYNEIDYP